MCEGVVIVICDLWLQIYASVSNLTFFVCFMSGLGILSLILDLFITAEATDHPARVTYQGIPGLQQTLTSLGSSSSSVFHLWNFLLHLFQDQVCIENDCLNLIGHFSVLKRRISGNLVHSTCPNTSWPLEKGFFWLLILFAPDFSFLF